MVRGLLSIGRGRCRVSLGITSELSGRASSKSFLDGKLDVTDSLSTLEKHVTDYFIAPSSSSSSSSSSASAPSAPLLVAHYNKTVHYDLHSFVLASLQHAFTSRSRFACLAAARPPTGRAHAPTGECEPRSLLYETLRDLSWFLGFSGLGARVGVGESVCLSRVERRRWDARLGPKLADSLHALALCTSGGGRRAVQAGSAPVPVRAVSTALNADVHHCQTSRPRPGARPTRAG